jgi:2,4-dienoyl-CoA reductase-like NADH-dependent reductase (Old Yellow Enzyme family)
MAATKKPTRTGQGKGKKASRRRGFQKLFEPIQIGKVSIPNRVAMAPMVCRYADGMKVSEQQLAYYGARARGGAGLIIIESVFVSKWALDTAPFNVPALYEPGHMIGLAELVDTIHAFGAKIFVQFTMGMGAQGMSLVGEQLVGPSAVSFTIDPEMIPRNCQEVLVPFMRAEVPREISVEEIKRELVNFVNGAVMARMIGFDGLEIHAGHGWLLHEFLSPRFNHRTDEYGGSFENRMRLLLEFLRRAKAAVGSDMAVGVRVSASEHVPGGLTYEDMKVVVQRLAQEGIDYLHTSDGCASSVKYVYPDVDANMLEASAGFKELVNVPVITPSIHDPELAEKAVSEGMTDMVALGRQLIADPNWANKVKEGRLSDITKCTRCNIGCMARILGGLPVKCILNPESGLERYNPEYTQWAAKRAAIEKKAGRAKTPAGR